MHGPSASAVALRGPLCGRLRVTGNMQYNPGLAAHSRARVMSNSDLKRPATCSPDERSDIRVRVCRMGRAIAKPIIFLHATVGFASLYPPYEEIKKEAERRQTRSPRPVRKRRTGRATEKAACAALPLRARSPAGVPLTALAAATERHRSAPVHALPGTELGRDGRYPPPAVPVQRAL